MTTSTLTPQLWTLHADSATESSLEEVGAKAWHLHQAALAGFPVPAGLALPPSAFIGGKLKPEWAKSLSAQLPNLGPGPFAVRSSGLAEDGAEQSFAGQFLTRLHVATEEVAAAAEAVAQSAQAAQAVAYQHGNSHEMAVLVQVMVPADLAGVAFAANPHTGERDQVVIEAVAGLGEKLVSGEATPARYVVAKGKPKREGTQGPELSEAQLAEISHAAQKLSQQFGCPQDIEWAFAEGKFHLLQSRPITALPPEPIPIPIGKVEGMWQLNDHNPIPTVIGNDLWSENYAEGMCKAFVDRGAPLKGLLNNYIGGHHYIQMATGNKPSEKSPPAAIMWLVTRLSPTFRKGNKRVLKRLEAKLDQKVLDDWDRKNRAAFARRTDSYDLKALPQLSDAALVARMKELRDYACDCAHAHADLHAAAVTEMALFSVFCRDELGWSFEKSLQFLSGAPTATSETSRQLQEIVRPFAERASQLDPNLPARAQLAQIPELLEAVDAHIEQHSLRLQFYDFNYPTLGEQPEVIYGQALAMMRHPQGTGKAQDRAAESAQLLAEARKQLQGSPKLAAFENMREYAQKGYALRDDMGAETVARPFGLIRHHLLEVGRRIPFFTDPEDVVHLTLEEALQALQGQTKGLAEKVHRRKGERQWAKLNPGPRYYNYIKEGELPMHAMPKGLRRLFSIITWMDHLEQIEFGREDGNLEGPQLKGTAASGGSYTGTARIVNGPADFARVAPGEIMVCRITTGEWSVVFSRVGALVTDDGGLLSHPAVIAREFGIPAVTGTFAAMSRIQDGDTITVDGDKGIVILPR